MNFRNYFQRLLLWFFLLQDIPFKSIIICNFSSNLSVVGCWLFFFVPIVSVIIDPDTCPRVWLKFFCGTYPNQTYWFASPIVLCKIKVGVSLGCNYLSTSIYFLSWSNLFFDLFTIAYFYCWLVFIAFTGSVFINLKLVLGCD